MDERPDSYAAAHAALRREAEEACRTDRLYPIRSNRYYGLYAGHLPGGRQALVALDGLKNIVAVIFDADGHVLDIIRRSVANVLRCPPGEEYMTVNETEFHEYLSREVGFTPALIRVKTFLEPEEGLAVYPLPQHIEEFLNDPETPFSDEERAAYPPMIRRWIRERRFVLDWGNDYWLDDDGEVTDS